MKAIIASTTLAFLSLFASAENGSPESLAAAGKLLETMDLKEEMATGFQLAMEPMIAPMVQQMGLNEAQVLELNQILTDWWGNDIDQDSIIEKIKVLYAERFTEEELNELALFYETDLGQKMLHTMPELTQAGMQIGMEEAGAQQGKLMEKMTAFQQRIAAENTPTEEEAAEEAPAPTEGE